MISVKIEGLNRLTQMIDTISTQLSPAELTVRAIRIAQEAGVVLHKGAVNACFDAVYSAPDMKWTPPVVHVTDNGWLGYQHGGNEPDRTNDLLEAHVLRDMGLVQIVEIDPDMPVSENAHADRELVIDYAIPVHEGYTQWVYGNDTGVFHPGRFWFDVVTTEMFPFLLQAIEDAFIEIVDAALEKAVA